MGLVRFGLLSTSNISRNLLATRSDVGVHNHHFEFAAVGSRDRARAEAYAREHGIERAHGSYEELLADEGVDAVYIALPNALHHEWTMRALAAGKHVLCEKPYSRRPEEVEQAFDAAGAAGLVLMEAYMWRHNPQTRLLRELLPRIGELQTVRATFAFRLTDPDNVRLVPELGGGALLDVGCYCVSASRLLAGEPDRLAAEAVLGPTGVDVRFSGLLRSGDVVTEFTCAFTTDHEGLEAIGADGTLVVPGPWHCHEGLVLLNGDEHRVEPVSSYRIELENMSAAIRGEAEPLLGREDALGQARALDGLLQAAGL